MPRAKKSASAGGNGRRTTKAVPQVTRPQPTYDDIATRAYELFMRRGGQHGNDCEDWLLAERELGAGAGDQG